MSRYASKENKVIVRKRAGGCCEYCKALRAFATSHFCAEHIIPFALGGSSELENLAYSCDICNINKAANITVTDPNTGQQIPLFNPRKDNWNDHFQWDDETLSIIGITLKGELTIQLLDMNRVEAVNLRRVLKAAGLHPPV